MCCTCCVCELPRSSGTRQLSQRRPIAGVWRRGRSVPCSVQFVLHLSYTVLELCGASYGSIHFGVSIMFGTVFWAGKCKARVRKYAGRKCRESWGPRVPGSLYRGLQSRSRVRRILDPRGFEEVGLSTWVLYWCICTLLVGVSSGCVFELG